MEASPYINSAEYSQDTDALFNNPALRAKLVERINSYNIFAPESDHLRPHQVEFIQNFQESVDAINKGEIENEGMSLLHPTGSGKTVCASEAIRMISNSVDDPVQLKTILLVPRNQILSQTVGNEFDPGAIQSFVPDVSIGEYSGSKKITDAAVTVMNYQSLRFAKQRGLIEEINPALIICDEVHHVIDGSWAQDIEEISKDRLLLGLTATPSYSASKDIRRLFPKVLSHKTLKEGIEEGILSEMQGYVYQGSSEIHVTKKGKDFAQEDLFAALGNSKDNYLAAAICAGEVANGNQGLVSCAPGFDRAHSKIVAKILNHTPTNTTEGKRFIRAVQVDGETHKESLQDIFRLYKNGQIDVITYTDLLLEGWDSPQTDFGVMLRPTKSRVLAEQRMGRVIRPRQGKVATIHEIIYDIIGDTQPQITHIDILKADRIVQGQYYGNGTSYSKNPNGKNGYKPDAAIFDVDQFTVDSSLLAEFTEAPTPAAMKDSHVGWNEDAVPFNWRTAQVLANKFKLDLEEVEKILDEKSVEHKNVISNGKSSTFYSTEANIVLAERAGIQSMPNGDERPLTISDLVEHARTAKASRRIRPATVFKLMEIAGIQPNLYIDDNNDLIKAYDYGHRDIPLTIAINKPKPGRKPNNYIKKPEKNEKVEIQTGAEEVMDWLNQILVNATQAETARQRQTIKAGQSLLINKLRERLKYSDLPEEYDAITEDVANNNLKPSAQMENVMHAKGMDFIELILNAKSAYEKFRQIQKISVAG
jgi:superfamily II DNA or RNA helicase